MSAGDVAGAVAVGFAAGVSSGMLGIGGGVLFIPGLVLILNLSQLRAESTSLLAIIPVAIVGALRQNTYGNVQLREGLVIGGLSALGVLAGVKLANVLPGKTLSYLFAAVLLYFAFTLARRALRG
ncbi:MAG: TSUP family transporter [Thermoleophilaceae bacterium]